MRHEPTYPPNQGMVIELQRDIAECNDDELRALRVVVDKLKSGRVGKPPLNVATDPRNWDAEARGEITDAIWYWAFAVVARGAQ